MEFQPFFVTGSPKSGTTWLAKLLDEHPQINCKGEACCYTFVSQLHGVFDQYNNVLEKRSKNFSEFNEFPYLDEPEFIAVVRHFFNLRLAVIANPDKPALKFVGEKDPDHAQNLPLLHTLFPEAKVFHIIRDGRAVVLSAWHHNLRNKTPGVQEAGFDGFLNEASAKWGAIIRKARSEARILGGRYLEVRYEDLWSDPVTQMKRVLDHLGADASEGILQACVEAASFESLTKGRKRGEEDPTSFFRKGLVDDWKNHMTPAQATRVNARSGGLLAELGYMD